MRRPLLILVCAWALLTLCAPLTAQVTFTFNFNDDEGTGFNDASLGAARQAALAAAASTISSYISTAAPRTIVLDVTSYSNGGSGTLAAAGSSVYYPISPGAGFFATNVQKKIQTGVDDSGAGADGTVSWNFGHAWALGDTVASGEFDFKSTAMHELMHTLGFLNFVKDTSSTTIGGVYTLFDSKLQTVSGTSVINQSTFILEQSGALTNDGLYFGGANAVAAYGGLVPIYSPSVWEQGSSGGHTRDSSFTGADALLMNHALTSGSLGARELSTVELAILQDLGYSLSAVPEPAQVALLLGLAPLALALQRRRARSA